MSTPLPPAGTQSAGACTSCLGQGRFYDASGQWRLCACQKLDAAPVESAPVAGEPAEPEDEPLAAVSRGGTVACAECRDPDDCRSKLRCKLRTYASVDRCVDCDEFEVCVHAGDCLIGRLRSLARKTPPWKTRPTPEGAPADQPTATCATNGHLYGPVGVCIFCEAPKPAQAPREPAAEPRNPYGIGTPEHDIWNLEQKLARAQERAEQAEKGHAESLAAYGEVLGELEAARIALAAREREAFEAGWNKATDVALDMPDWHMGKPPLMGCDEAFAAYLAQQPPPTRTEPKSATSEGTNTP